VRRREGSFALRVFHFRPGCRNAALGCRSLPLSAKRAKSGFDAHGRSALASVTHPHGGRQLCQPGAAARPQAPRQAPRGCACHGLGTGALAEGPFCGGTTRLPDMALCRSLLSMWEGAPEKLLIRHVRAAGGGPDGWRRLRYRRL